MNTVSLRAALVVLLVVAVAGCGVTISSAPALISPPDAALLACRTTGSYAFVWSRVPNAISYILEVWTVATPPVQVVSQTVTTTNASVDFSLLPCDAGYRWRVGATFAISPTVWSGYWTFTILPP